MYVFDATPLIYLAKAEYLDIVAELDARCVVPKRVYEEVVIDGLDAGYPDARRIESQVEHGLFDVVAVEETEQYGRLVQNPNVSEADVAVLTLAATHDATAVMDEAYGRTVAETENITTRGTAYLLLSLVDQGTLSADEARDIIDAIIEEGWHCSTKLYAKIVRKLESLRDGSSE
ncbi:DUF3368 domain-containing protein [Halospeciosus flavus]|uniref:DUF3368 domain-containing protein n=1 Tax=Halospeciosus flavus TaxID=3032283 RepID=A0ABD5Z3F3_9EURY|nr:DUF3368 domain-containing protein [Halospeciosus flavus]